MEGEVTPSGEVVAESALILSGPDDSIFDDIFDWIANAIAVITSTVTDWISRAWSAITTTVTSWITWLWNTMLPWIKPIWDWITAVRVALIGWVSTKVGELWSWITTSLTSLTSLIGAWFSETWSRTTALFSTWFTQLGTLVTSIHTYIHTYFTSLGDQLESQFTWLGSFIWEQVVAPMAAWWDQLLDRLLDVGSWIGGLLDGIAAWLKEDVPGHSPRWTAIFEGIGDWFKRWLWEFPQWMFGNFPERVAYGLSESLKWVGEVFNNIFETFMDAIMGIVQQIGPTNPSTAIGSYSAMAKVGMLSLGALAGMTIAGETLNPISHLGLGHISAMIYDMTNYKIITGVFMGALTFAMLRQPLTYYFNQMFRPYILREGHFMDLMSRAAFTNPENLRNPPLTATVQELTRGDGAAWERQMIGFYGFPAQYYGFFKELSFSPLRYFPLAGIARGGFWDEAWFTEALSRSGYSPTAREALMNMYREQVLVARQLPVMSQVRRLSREGFSTIEEIRTHLEKAAGMEDMTEIRLFAMELELEFASKEMAFDIIMRAFTRGIIPESETRKGLAGLGVPRDLIDVHLLREKLGLLRRISIPTEEAAPPLIGVEE